MSNFFDKLKKGMGADGGIEENQAQDLEQRRDVLESASTEGSLAGKNEEIKKTRSSKKKKEKEITSSEAPEQELLSAPKEIVKKTGTIKIEEKPSAKDEPMENASAVFKAGSWFEPEGQLTVDVYQTDGEIVIQSAIAGVKPENLEISIENDIVTIRGERRETREKEKKNYFYQECYWGRFSREIILPSEVDSVRARAEMKDGVLTIRAPKIERGKKRLTVG
jgi:HSP20 family molecular chaperone IbpA